MFTQIAMTADEQRFYRLLWFNGNESADIMILQWLYVIFGEKPSPDLVGYALRFLAEKCKTEYPRGASAVLENIMFCEESCMKAKEVITEVDTILSGGNINVKVWNSNSLEVDQNKNEVIVDLLGHLWNKIKDTSMKHKYLEIEVSKFTKRNLTSAVAKLWDPLGYLLPVSIQYQIDLQRIWQEGYNWDQLILLEMVDTWKNHLYQMNSLKEIIRCL